MKKEFNIEIYEGHCMIIDGDRKMLVDTGSPMTISNSDFTFLGKETQSVKTFQGITLDSISELMGYKITQLIGVDVLSQYDILFDYPSEKITFYEQFKPESDYNAIAFTSMMKVPKIKLEIDGGTFDFIIDTGAKLSYADHDLVNGTPTVGKVNDYHPLIGQFVVDTYSKDFKVGDLSIKGLFGTLPPTLQPLMSLTQSKGFIGYDLFKGNQVYLCYSSQKIYLR